MSGESIKEISMSDKKALKGFVSLERQFVGSNPLFVSDIDVDVINRLSGRSSFYGEMEHTLFVASCRGGNVARCAAFINRGYQSAKKEAVGFIGYFAAVSDRGPDVASLLGRAEDWLRMRGVTRVIAPYNGAALLGMGLRTTAFDEEPMFPFVWHPPYYAEYFVNAGYEPAYPLWYFTVEFSSEKYRATVQRAKENREIVVRPINKKRWRVDLETVRELFNQNFKKEWEFHPYNSKEFFEFFDPLKPVLDSRQLLIGEVDGEPAGWCLGLPDWNPLFRSFNGKFRPIQLIRLMIGGRRYRRAGLIGIGVSPGYKGSGLAHALATTLYRRYQEQGLKEAFYYPVNEGNIRSRKFAESMGGTGRVLYHCYDKTLGG